MRLGLSLVEQRTVEPGMAQPFILPEFAQCTVAVEPFSNSTSAKKRL